MKTLLTNVLANLSATVANNSGLLRLAAICAVVWGPLVYMARCLNVV